MTDDLKALGWNAELDAAWQKVTTEACVPARVVADYGQAYKVAMPQEVQAEASGRMQHLLETHERPKIGDWVAVQILDNGRAAIHEVLPRRTEISRRRPGELYERQVLAANVDLAFLVQALDDDFSPERLRRYIFQLQKAGIAPVIVLNKADKADDIAAKVAELDPLNLKVIVISALEQTGVEQITELIAKGQTAVFLGSSGVGKSTITNTLLGEQRQQTAAIREDDSKGRHTTTHRELFVLPNGGLIIDTPGLRELQLWGTEDDLSASFSEIETLARKCKFSNCSHHDEPGCAVLQAERDGVIDSAQLRDYFKFQQELRHLKTKVDAGAAAKHKQANKKIQKAYRENVQWRKGELD